MDDQAPAVSPDGPTRSLDEAKQIRVKITVRQHIRLHSLRLMTGRTISGIVCTALGLYLDRLEDEGHHLNRDGTVPWS